MNLDSPVTALGGVGKKRSELYAKLGIEKVGDLLWYLPRTYIDYTTPTPISELQHEETSVVRAQVMQKTSPARIRQNLVIYKIVVADDSDTMTVTFFNNPYVFDSLDVGREYYFRGKSSGGFMRKEMNSPTVVSVSENELIRPVYHLTEGLTSNMLITNVKAAVSLVGDDYPDELPKEIRQKYNLCAKNFAFRNIHFPENENGLKLAINRLGFEELFYLQLGMMLLKNRNRSHTGFVLKNTDISEYELSLPFEMTGAQKKACAEIAADMTKEFPMNRLLQGDVGSGKTAVAAAACYLAVRNGAQAALMAPTEILAKQHYATLSAFLEPVGIKVCCLTGSLTPKAKTEMKNAVAAGEYDVIVGTHAIIAATTEFNNLGLVITDEQHRFGVNQRKALAEKGNMPHKLVMSATPIPRTLALIIYGDLDISVLNELPKGRQPVETYAVSGKKRERAWGFVKKELDSGRQAYIVCPLVEDSEKSEAMAATEYKIMLDRGPFAGYRTGLLHGQMKGPDKDAVMESFKNGEIDLLICTTVVEVGVDVPNSTIMMIENADRFGLSQLHQLRGRVGRGKYKSYCILVTDNPTEETAERLKIMTATNDGFKISEEDLKLRGAGDFFGEKQHGIPPMKIPSAASDSELVRNCHEAAAWLIGRSPDLSEYPEIRNKVEQLFSENAENGMN